MTHVYDDSSLKKKCIILLILKLTDVMCGGMLSPVASTGISSYLLKLMPVFPVPNNSTSNRSSLEVGIVQSISEFVLPPSLSSFHRPPPIL